MQTRVGGLSPYYDTWDEFRAELKRRSGVVILNNLWFQIKPKSPLPWNEIQLKDALSRLSFRISKLKECPRCGGFLVFDRDIHGCYKKCVQCSFESEITDVSEPNSNIIAKTLDPY
jgi:hypothetical protein